MAENICRTRVLFLGCLRLMSARLVDNIWDLPLQSSNQFVLRPCGATQGDNNVSHHRVRLRPAESESNRAPSNRDPCSDGAASGVLCVMNLDLVSQERLEFPIRHAQPHARPRKRPPGAADHLGGNGRCPRIGICGECRRTTNCNEEHNPSSPQTELKHAGPHCHARPVCRLTSRLSGRPLWGGPLEAVVMPHAAQ